jgi:hypothetical protein
MCCNKEERESLKIRERESVMAKGGERAFVEGKEHVHP